LTATGSASDRVMSGWAGRIDKYWKAIPNPQANANSKMYSG
jgi:hypothetical protein